MVLYKIHNPLFTILIFHYSPKNAFGIFFLRHLTKGAPKVKFGTKWLEISKTFKISTRTITTESHINFTVILSILNIKWIKFWSYGSDLMWKLPLTRPWHPSVSSQHRNPAIFDTRLPNMKDQHWVLKDQFCILDNTLQPYLFVDAWLAATSCTPIIMFRTFDLRTAGGRYHWSPRPATSWYLLYMLCINESWLYRIP